MVVILMGGARSVSLALGRALATGLEWPLEDVEGPAELRVIATRAADRRQPVVIVSPEIDPHQRDVLRREWHRLRFVRLVTDRVSSRPSDDLVVDTRESMESTVAAIRREFGI